MAAIETVQGRRGAGPWLWAILPTGLLIPAAAMQVTTEVRWGAEDFLAAAILLALALGGIDVAMRLPRHDALRWVVGGGAVVAALLIWAEAAVGLFH